VLKEPIYPSMEITAVEILQTGSPENE
jgi:hypothetical protein